MKEGIAARVTRIISGSVNALIDAVESAAPAVMMEETIREIDGATDEVRTELRELVANRHMANARLMEENRRHEDLAEKIALALQENRDDLAKVAIARQIDIEAQIPVLERMIAEAGERERELDAYLTALLARRREMTEQLRSYLSTRDQKGATTDGAAGTDTANEPPVQTGRKADAAEFGFNRILKRQTGLSGSTSENADATARLAELEDLARENRVLERLLEAKGDRTQ